MYSRLCKIFFIMICVIVMILPSNSFGQRLTMTPEEIQEKQCDIVAAYYDFKKHVQVVINRTELPRIRHANKIALMQLLNRRFTATGVNFYEGENRNEFIENLWKGSNDYSILKKTYETFDCPNFDFINEITPIKSQFEQEIEEMQMDIVDKNIKTTKYKGRLYFAEISVSSYDVNRTILNDESNGIFNLDEIKSLGYEMYKVSEEEYVLKLTDLRKADTRKVQLRDTIFGGFETKKIKMRDFEPCCQQPVPPDYDGDGYNFLVDCNEQDPTIYPGSREILSDGIDQDCDGKDANSEDLDKDGYYYSACQSLVDSIRQYCDCNDQDPGVYFRDSSEMLKADWINPYNGWNDDNCDCIVDTEVPFDFDSLTFWDYALVGKGHLIRGQKKGVRYSFAAAYAATFWASTGYAVYSKVRSENFYDQHKNSLTLRQQDELYDKANRHHKHFLISGGIAVTTFALQALHLKIKDSKEVREYEKGIDELRSAEPDYNECVINFEPYFVPNYSGISMRITF